MRYVILVLMLLATTAFAYENPITGASSTDQIGNPNRYSAKEVLGAGNLSLTFTGIDTLTGANATSTTSWMQIGWVSNNYVANDAGNYSNRMIQQFAPQNFTMTIDLDAINDSVGLAGCYFELADDTTGTVGWSPDSTNYFIKDGNEDRTWADVWVWEELPAVADDTPIDTLAWKYPLRVVEPSYIRFTFIQGVLPDADSVTVNWKLKCTK